MNQLYPIKFKPFIQERIWGGERLHSVLGKDTKGLKLCGESWELSAVHGHISVVTNGFLKGNNLQELVEVYMGDLVGEEVYERFGDEFPLLIKFIDAEDDLSIQVHPNDEMSKERHNAYGKTEMWYVLEADPGARLNAGFRKQADQSLFLDYLQSGRLEEILNFEQVTSGDVFFIPAGRVHAIGKGILLAEIQQTSDVTYRIYDYGRKDKEGKERELHLDLALDAIDYSVEEKYKTDYQAVKNESTKIVSCPYFTTHILEVSGKVVKDYTWLDSFVIYICVDGDGIITWEEGKETVKKGETILVPATLGEFTLTSVTGNFRLLEVFIESENGD